MQQLLKRVAAFLYHVMDAPESAEETVEAAKELEEDVVKEIQRLGKDGEHNKPTRK